MIYYQIDREGFIEKYCENIDKPVLKCNGKCKMAKVATETNNEEQKPEFIVNIEPLIFITTNTTPNNIFNITPIKKTLYFYLNNYTFLSLYAIDYPPKV